MTEPPWKGDVPLSGADYSAMELSADATRLYVLDQRRLPVEEVYLTYGNVSGAAMAIRDMVVRGAPAIGITAAYGMVLAAREAGDRHGEAYVGWLRTAAEQLITTRPTAVNLAWAVNRCLELAAAHAGEPPARRHLEMADLARRIHRDDVSACRAMGKHGAARLPAEGTVLTHCNAGALATGGYGTALGVIRAATETGNRIRVIATETRPYLQGARLTAWELHRDRIPVTVIADDMVGHCMATGRVNAVVVGADRIAKNGDVANKIGTYSIACLAEMHDIPFYVAAPWSTVDLATPSGAEIVIEERKPKELTHLAGQALVPDGVRVYNPAFDVTPARLITAIITERGAVEPSDLALSP
jgi:methylthioribose-1-phosphate isomerase